MDRQADTDNVPTDDEDGLRALPWGVGDGLAPVLSKPNLWIPVLELARLRKIVKDVAKDKRAARIVSHSGVVRIEDDQVMGRLMVELLSDATGRQALAAARFDERKWGPLPYAVRKPLARARHGADAVERMCLFLGDILIFVLMNSSPLPIGSRAVAMLGSVWRQGVDPESLADWLAREDLDDPTVADVAVSIAACALVQPEARAALGATLLRADVRFEKHVGSGATRLPAGRSDQASDVPKCHDDSDGADLDGDVSPNRTSEPVIESSPPDEALREHDSVTDFANDDPPVVREIASQLLTVRSANERLQQDLAIGRNLAEAFESLSVARGDLARATDPVESRLQALRMTVPPIEQAIRGGAEEVDRYLADLRRAVRRLDDEQRKELQREIAALRTELRQLGAAMAVPSPADSPHEWLIAERDELRSLVEEERAYRKLCEQQDDEPLIEIANPARRLVLYERVAREVELRVPDNVLVHLVRDDEARLSAPSRSRALLLGQMHRSARVGRVLPTGIWYALTALCDAPVLEALADGELDHKLAALPDGAWCSDELLLVLENTGAEPSGPLARALKRARIRRLPLAEQVVQLAAAALEADLSADALAELLIALHEAGRLREAFLVGAFAVRARREIDARRLGEVVAAVLLQATEQSDAARRIIHDLAVFLDPGELREWMEVNPDTAPVFLYLAHVSGADETVVNLMYGATDQIEAAKKSRPVLMERWLLPRIDGAPEPHAGAVDIPTVRLALDEWAHDLQRRAAYANLPSAADYQEYFNGQLTAAMDAVRAGAVCPSLTPREMIEEARTAWGLMRVNGSADVAMTRYLTDQIGRLRCIAGAVEEAGGWNPLDRMLNEVAAVPLHDALEGEASALSSSPALKWLYARAVRDAHGRR